MSWTRLDDVWTDDQVINELSFEDRWHYLAMIQFCSRTKAYDGVMRAIDAKRCSDHPDTHGALKRMALLGLVVDEGNTFRLTRLDEHIPPPSVRESSEQTKIRVQRHRKHKNGDHSECISEKCVTGNVTRYPRTGQDRTGSLPKSSSEAEVLNKTTGELTSVPASLNTPVITERVDQCEDCGIGLMEDGACWSCPPVKKAVSF